MSTLPVLFGAVLGGVTALAVLRGLPVARSSGAYVKGVVARASAHVKSHLGVMLRQCLVQCAEVLVSVLVEGMESRLLVGQPVFTQQFEDMQVNMQSMQLQLANVSKCLEQAVDELHSHRVECMQQSEHDRSHAEWQYWQSGKDWYVQTGIRESLESLETFAALQAIGACACEEATSGSAEGASRAGASQSASAEAQQRAQGAPEVEGQQSVVQVRPAAESGERAVVEVRPASGSGTSGSGPWFVGSPDFESQWRAHLAESQRRAQLASSLALEPPRRVPHAD